MKEDTPATHSISTGPLSGVYAEVAVGGPGGAVEPTNFITHLGQVLGVEAEGVGRVTHLRRRRRRRRRGG